MVSQPLSIAGLFMPTAMNLARIACPQQNASGKCDAANCPYNHSKIESSQSMVTFQTQSVSLVKHLTGVDGQFVGARKGANCIPINKGPGELPAFLARVNRPSTVTQHRQTAERKEFSNIDLRQPERSAPVYSAQHLISFKNASPPTYPEMSTEALMEELSSSDLELQRLCTVRQSLDQELDGLEAELAQLRQSVTNMQDQIAKSKPSLPSSFETFATANANNLRQVSHANRAVAMQIARAKELSEVHTGIINECRQQYDLLFEMINSSGTLNVNKQRHDVVSALGQIDRLFRDIGQVIHNVGVDFTVAALTKQNQLLAAENRSLGNGTQVKAHHPSELAFSSMRV